MKSIYKYTVPFKEVAEVVMHGAFPQIVRVDGIDGQIYMWAIVDTDEPKYVHTFNLFKTGMEMPSNIGQYVYYGCGAIHIGMELMMYVFQDCLHAPKLYVEPEQWKGFGVLVDNGGATPV